MAARTICKSSLQLVLGGKQILYPDRCPPVVAGGSAAARSSIWRGLSVCRCTTNAIRSLARCWPADAAGFGEIGIVEPVLRCAAARFAQVLELGRTREQGRAEGLVDALTGLPNRLLFNDRLDTIIREATRNGECFAVLFVDLDRFKAINDTYGHAAGDQVLRMVTQRLCGSIRASDTVARYAGDEFTIVLRHIVKNDDVLRVAEKIVQVMEAPLYLDDGTELQVTASMGVSFFPDDAGDAQTLLKHADEAMYSAKHLGRNKFQIYEVSPEYAKEHGMALRIPLAACRGQRRVAGGLPAPGQCRDRGHRGHGGAGALGASRAGHDQPGGIHSARRGNRPDRLDRRVGDAHGVSPGQGMGADATDSPAPRA